MSAYASSASSWTTVTLPMELWIDGGSQFPVPYASPFRTQIRGFVYEMEKRDALKSSISAHFSSQHRYKNLAVQLTELRIDWDHKGLRICHLDVDTKPHAHFRVWPSGSYGQESVADAEIMKGVQFGEKPRKLNKTKSVKLQLLSFK